MSGTDEAAQSPAAPVVPPVESNSEEQPRDAQTDQMEHEERSDEMEEETNADAMEQETKTDEPKDDSSKKAEDSSDMQSDPPKRSQQLLDAAKSEEKGHPIQFISCMSEEGRGIVSKKLNRGLMHEECKSGPRTRLCGTPELTVSQLRVPSPFAMRMSIDYTFSILCSAIPRFPGPASTSSLYRRWRSLPSPRHIRSHTITRSYS